LLRLSCDIAEKGGDNFARGYPACDSPAFVALFQFESGKLTIFSRLNFSNIRVKK
jgi:hypothetical protein